MFNTAIVIIIYNRPELTAQILAPLKKVKPRNLFVASDAPKNSADKELVLATQQLFESLDWDCKLIKDYAEQHMGLSIRITSAISNALQLFDRVIILEDDVLADVSFFYYCEQLLERYQDNKHIMQIRGVYSLKEAYPSPYSYLFTQAVTSWGWATWKRAWDGFDHSWIASASTNSTDQQSAVNIFPNDEIFFNKSWPSIDRYPELKTRINNTGNYFSSLMKQWDMKCLGTPWAFGFALWLMKQNGMVISPLKNMISNIGFGWQATHTKDHTHSMAKLQHKRLPLPLIHPPTIAIDSELHQKLSNNSNDIVGNILIPEDWKH